MTRAHMHLWTAGDVAEAMLVSESPRLGTAGAMVASTLLINGLLRSNEGARPVLFCDYTWSWGWQ